VTATLRQVSRLLDRGLEVALGLLLVALVCVTFAAVIGRYVLNVSMPWSEELIRLLFVWLVMIGAARSPHMRIDLLENILSPAARRTVNVLIAFLSIGLLAMLVWYAFDLIALTANDTYTSLGISVQYLYWALIVGGGLWVARLILALALHTEEHSAEPL
jgi:TRAP-type C4-dicarboxylate transport system permease small subunit